MVCSGQIRRDFMNGASVNKYYTLHSFESFDVEYVAGAKLDLVQRGPEWGWRDPWTGVWTSSEGGEDPERY